VASDEEADAGWEIVLRRLLQHELVDEQLLDAVLHARVSVR
jgi:hypothetical protein